MDEKVLSEFWIPRIITLCHVTHSMSRKITLRVLWCLKKGNNLFNDALNIFYSAPRLV